MRPERTPAAETLPPIPAALMTPPVLREMIAMDVRRLDLGQELGRCLVLAWSQGTRQEPIRRWLIGARHRPDPGTPPPELREASAAIGPAIGSLREQARAVIAAERTLAAQSRALCRRILAEHPAATEAERRAIRKILHHRPLRPHAQILRSWSRNLKAIQTEWEARCDAASAPTLGRPGPDGG